MRPEAVITARTPAERNQKKYNSSRPVEFVDPHQRRTAPVLLLPTRNDGKPEVVAGRESQRSVLRVRIRLSRLYSVGCFLWIGSNERVVCSIQTLFGWFDFAGFACADQQDSATI